MDYLQYSIFTALATNKISFKPYYKWITFNMAVVGALTENSAAVLNLIINGLPSISFDK